MASYLETLAPELLAMICSEIDTSTLCAPDTEDRTREQDLHALSHFAHITGGEHRFSVQATLSTREPKRVLAAHTHHARSAGVRQTYAHGADVRLSCGLGVAA